MNAVLKNLTSTNYYLVSIWKEHDEYVIKTKWLRCVDQVTKIFNFNIVEKFKSLKEAKHRCRVLIKNKINKQGMEVVAEDKLPPSIMTHFAPPTESQMTPEEFLQLIIKTRTERYVTFKENSGMDNFFDIGIQYVGYITDDPYMLEIYDKFGHLRSISLHRLESIVKTEDCLQAEKVGK